MSRTRSAASVQPDENVHYDNYYTYQQIEDGDPPDDVHNDADSAQCPGGEYSTMTDHVIENFYARMKKGEIFNNPMSKEHVIYNSTPHTFSYNYDGESIDSSGNGYSGHLCQQGSWKIDGQLGTPSTLCSSSAIPYIDVDQMKELAVTSAWANIDLSDAAVLATLGEAKETIVSLIDISKRVIKIIRAVKRLDAQALAGAFSKRDLKKLISEFSPGELSNRYMEYRYALRPLYYDARMLMKALSTAQATFKPMRQTFRGRENRHAINSNSNQDAYISTLYTTKYGEKFYRDVTVRAGVLTDIESLSQFNIWGLDQPLETIWELTPFSFIVDWFFNVGRTLASWTPEMGTKTLASWVVVEDTLVAERYFEGVDAASPFPTNYFWKSFSGDASGRISIARTLTTREVNPQRSIIPTFSLNLDCLKLVDLGIILRKLFDSK